MPDDSPATPSDVIARARKAQVQWAALPVSERAHRLRPLLSLALRRAELLARTVHEETGKPETEALIAEALGIADIVDYWTCRIENFLQPDNIELDPLTFPNKSGHVEYIPRGVLALITPWTFPVAIPMRHIIPALLAGNAVVFKPSEHTPSTGKLVGSFFDKLLPPHLLTVLEGGPDVGQALIQSGVDGVVFTGSIHSGRRVAVTCAESLVPCSLQLGGNDAAIVLADAHVERTAQGIVWGAFNNTGQNCAAISRVFVVRTIADKLIPRIVAATQQLQPNRDFGPLITQAHFELARSQLAQAVEQGAEVLTGGTSDASTRSLPPTVLRVEASSIELLQSETAGPILPIVVVENEADAVALANGSSHGLTASIWTRRIRRGKVLARRLLCAGVVTINNHGFTATLPMAPWSGVGNSGDGVANGPYALRGYTRPRFILADRRRASHELWWFPYSDTLHRLGLQAARMRGGTGFFGRIAAFFVLLLLLPKRLWGK